MDPALANLVGQLGMGGVLLWFFYVVTMRLFGTFERLDAARRDHIEDLKRFIECGEVTLDEDERERAGGD